MDRILIDGRCSLATINFSSNDQPMLLAWRVVRWNDLLSSMLPRAGAAEDFFRINLFSTLIQPKRLWEPREIEPLFHAFVCLSNPEIAFPSSPSAKIGYSYRCVNALYSKMLST